ncbi:MAG: N-formylglutamate amidohydrolase [Rhizobiaceae bacterium]
MIGETQMNRVQPARARQTYRVADLVNPAATGPFILVCEHASSRMPPSYASLGLPASARRSHVAWDPGALAVARHLSSLLDSPLIAHRYSRLLYDCNRPPESAGAVVARSEVFDIPGNTGLSPEELNRRADLFYHPFREQLGELIEMHHGVGAPALVTIHSFTPVYHGRKREVEVGILHDEDDRLAREMLAHADRFGGLVVRENEPYGPTDGVTHTLKEHGLARGMANVMIEVRNDLIATPVAQARMARLLADVLSEAHASVTGKGC